jgi:hypothetical protein
MKTTMRLLAAAACVIAAASTLFAGTGGPYSFNRQLAEDNLILGVTSDNCGLRASSASILAEVGTVRSVLPLLALLHNGGEDERIASALALSKIGDARGEWAVQRAAQYDESAKVRRLAGWYYSEYVVPKPEEPISVPVAFDIPEPYPYEIATHAGN